MYFGIAQEITGRTTESIDSGDTTDLSKKILNKYPGLKSVSFRLALNGTLLKTEAELGDGDTIAILPPFAGG